MSARDELAQEIFLTDNHKFRDQAAKEWDASERPEYVYGIADGLIAAGYRKPRTVTEYGMVFNRSAASLTPPALSLDEFKDRYPRETGWFISDRDVYIQRTRQEVGPLAGEWEAMPTTDVTP